MARRKEQDIDTATAELIVAEERQAEETARMTAENARQEQADRERRIAECHQVIGRIQGAKMVADFANVGGLMWFKQVKETKLYREIPGLGSWEKFCESVGISRQKVDEDLLNLATFGEAFLQTVGGFSVGYRELKKLRQLTHEGAVQIEDDTVTIGGELIPLDAEHREDLQAALERVIEAKDALLQEKDAVIRSNEKLLQSKQDLLRRQEKDLARYEDAAEKKGLTADEDAFIRKTRNARVSVDGFFMQFDPERFPLPEDATPRMKAELMSTLAYFKQVCDAAYDTAGDLYGDAEIEGAGWTPPHLRDAGGAGDAMAAWTSEAEKVIAEARNKKR